MSGSIVTLQPLDIRSMRSGFPYSAFDNEIPQDLDAFKAPIPVTVLSSLQMLENEAESHEEESADMEIGSILADKGKAGPGLASLPKIMSQDRNLDTSDYTIALPSSPPLRAENPLKTTLLISNMESVIPGNAIGAEMGMLRLSPFPANCSGVA
eukprot:Sspe_Gene.98594::Locus_71989_Transcript_1_1_Confidence_1.000_Length_608::g.98594::m.98594